MFCCMHITDKNQKCAFDGKIDRSSPMLKKAKTEMLNPTYPFLDPLCFCKQFLR